jgi:hypothetical protein
MLTLVAGLLAPTRLRLAFRVLAGAIGMGYAAYLVSELWSLLRGDVQPLAFGRPSALMAGLGFVVFGIPALVFAFSGQLVGLARRFRAVDKRSNDSDAAT